MHFYCSVLIITFSYSVRNSLETYSSLVGLNTCDEASYTSFQFGTTAEKLIASNRCNVSSSLLTLARSEIYKYFYLFFHSSYPFLLSIILSIMFYIKEINCFSLWFTLRSRYFGDLNRLGRV